MSPCIIIYVRKSNKNEIWNTLDPQNIIKIWMYFVASIPKLANPSICNLINFSIHMMVRDHIKDSYVLCCLFIRMMIFHLRSCSPFNISIILLEPPLIISEDNLLCTTIQIPCYVALDFEKWLDCTPIGSTKATINFPSWLWITPPIHA